MNIKDYLKYYIGCKCFYATDEPCNETYVLTPSRLAGATEFGAVPILRKASSLTDDECMELHRISPYFDAKASEEYVKNRLYVIRENITNKISMRPERFHYLLSIGIDLFGLIDAGLAIDAATIKTEGK